MIIWTFCDISNYNVRNTIKITRHGHKQNNMDDQEKKQVTEAHPQLTSMSELTNKDLK